jgi:hypothetical protein
MSRTAHALWTVVGMLAALGWAALFVEAPRVAMELLVLVSPVAVPIWLIVMLSAPRRAARGRSRDGASHLSPAAPAEPASLTGGPCAVCGAPVATTLVARRPARRGDPGAGARVIALCSACAAASPLPSVAAGPRRA